MNAFDLCESFQFNFSSRSSANGSDGDSSPFSAAAAAAAAAGNRSPCLALLDAVFFGGGDERQEARASSDAGADNRSRYTRDLIAYYVTGIAGLTVSCLGIVGNTVSVIVLTRGVMRSSTYTYLSALAVCDSAFLVCIILLTAKDLRRPQVDVGSDRIWDTGEGFYSYLFQYVHPVANTLQVTSIWLTLAFTVDRYIVICHPFQSENFCTISRARRVVLGLSLAGAVYSVPKFFEYRTVRVVHPTRGTVRVRCDLTPFGKTRLFRQLYHSWLYVTFVCGLPFAALAVLNAFLVRAVRASSRRSGELSAVLRRRNDTTVMLISVVAVFFVCQTPALVSRVVWAHADDARTFTQVGLYALNEIGNLLVFVNSSVNFIPYYLFGRRFRRQLKRLVGNCCCGGGGGVGRTGARGRDYSPSQLIYSFTMTGAVGVGAGATGRRRPTQDAVEYRRESPCFGYRDSLI